MNKSQILTFFIALVWFLNGLFCKVLNLVPRHHDIVERILGASHSKLLTTLIGISEIFMAVWVLSKIQPRLCAIVQMSLVLVMNLIEMTLAPDLLLWGKTNMLFALLFIGVVYVNEFVFKRTERDL